MSRPTTSEQTRQAFLDFFREKGHTILPSAPLVPQDDPTLLFINAGMNPFKDVFLGTGSRPYVRVADTQKCLRVSGKHNDLEEVGHDTYHHTFFEMLGNWSFGDYFKKEAIGWAWELLVDRWGLTPDRLYATVHEGDSTLGLEPDDEAAGFWRSETSIPADNILYGSSDDNFWMMGDTGPCGPCSELHIDLRTDEERAVVPGKVLVNTSDPRVIEIWNLVFIQYNAQSDGSLQPLAAKHVDTGMGFERLCAVLQGTSSTYDTDLFAPLFEKLHELCDDPAYADSDEPRRIAMRVVADHIRTLAFAIADGAAPGNTGRGYVIRRILRRAVRYGYQGLGFREPFLWKLVAPLTLKMGAAFPELPERQTLIERTIRAEEEGFLRTLGAGLTMFESVLYMVKRIEDASNSVIDPETLAKYGQDHSDLMDLGRAIASDNPKFAALLKEASESWIRKNNIVLDTIAKSSPDELHIALHRFATTASFGLVASEIVFLLHDTYGFPSDLTALIASERGLSIDWVAFDRLMEEQRTRARAAGTFTVDQSSIGGWQDVSSGDDSQFFGYDYLALKDVSVRRVRKPSEDTERYEIVLDRTPFYAESGGQMGDTGTIDFDGYIIYVVDTRKLEDGTIVHITESLPSDLSVPVSASVDAVRRQRIMRHHSATHLLHAALREALGDHVQQKGSLVAPDRLRFDFAHFEKVTPEEQSRIEERVNELVLRNIPVQIETDVPLAEARARGAMALFGEKYGEAVRVVTIDPEISIELCGGTHVKASGEVGLFRIVSESSIASGVRRVEAVAGEAALAHASAERQSLLEVQSLFKNLQQPISEVVGNLLDEKKAIEKELADLKTKSAAANLQQLLNNPTEINGARLVTADIGPANMDTLRDIATDLREKLGPDGVAVLGSIDPEGQKVYLAAAVSDDLIKRGLQAGKLVGTLAKLVDGGGGGRPQLATAGGKNPENLVQALAAAEAEVAASLG